MVSLNLPQRNDPISKILLCVLLAAALWANVAQFEQPTQANASPGYTIINATPQPTPALPTAPAELPAFGLAAPTPTPQSWLDQGLAAVGAAGDQFAQSQADQLAAEQATALAAQQAEAARLAAEQAARDQYLANVGAQASHSPRGNTNDPPPSQTGPIAQPDGAIIVPAGSDYGDPAPDPAAPAIAVAVPGASAEQQAVIGARTSNGCKDGEVFYPRSGCHLPGSGGAMPGAVGAP